jgi:hypothetical protein
MGGDIGRALCVTGKCLSLQGEVMSERSDQAFARGTEALPQVSGNLFLKRHTVHRRRACRGCSQETVLPLWRRGRDQRYHEITGRSRG